MIWFQNYSISDVNKLNKNTMMEHLDIVITELQENSLVATMPVDHRTVQPLRMLHGGASAVLAESLGSIAANLTLDRDRFFALGMNLSINHLKSAFEGEKVTARAFPEHLGRSTQLWNIEVRNEREEIVALSRLTMVIKERK